jgi:hypothetical protein
MPKRKYKCPPDKWRPRCFGDLDPTNKDCQEDWCPYRKVCDAVTPGMFVRMFPELKNVTKEQIKEAMRR